MLRGPSGKSEFWALVHHHHWSGSIARSTADPRSVSASAPRGVALDKTLDHHGGHRLACHASVQPIVPLAARTTVRARELLATSQLRPALSVSPLRAREPRLLRLFASGSAERVGAHGPTPTRGSSRASCAGL
jgi:hypothetical protein